MADADDERDDPMRVTDTMLWDMSRRHLVRAQARMFTATERVSSGLRLEKPSDAPADVGGLRAAEASLFRLRAGQSSATRAEMQLTAAEGALAEAGSVLGRAREIAVAGADGSQNARTRAALAIEVAGLRETMRSLANTRVGSIHVFGGFKTAAPPFLADGTFVGDGGVRQVEVLPGLRVAANVSGVQAFTAAGGVDVFAVLAQLEADLLANDGAAVAANLTSIDTASQQVLAQRTAAGTHLTRVQSSDAIRADSIVRLEAARSGLRDADVPAVITEMAQAQNSLRLALETASQVLEMTKAA
jgi:flagellar hook-associated protein 3 FlgL